MPKEIRSIEEQVEDLAKKQLKTKYFTKTRWLWIVTSKGKDNTCFPFVLIHSINRFLQKYLI